MNVAHKLCAALLVQGNYQRADHLYRHALDIDERTFGRYNLHLIRDLRSWAMMLQAQVSGTKCYIFEFQGKAGSTSIGIRC